MATITITEDNFDAEVIASDKPVLLDFWASWCGPCQMVSPTMEEISNEVLSIKVGKINVDEQPVLAAKYGVMSIPTIMVIKNGEVANSLVGAWPKENILQALQG